MASALSARCATHAGAETGHERQHQQAGADEQERPLVAGEVGGSLHQQQHQHERRDRDEGPRGLQPGEAHAEAGDHHVADAVQQHCERQHRAVGAAGEQSVGHVCRQQQTQQRHEERDDARWNLRVGAERCERVGDGRDDGGHHHQAQFAVPTGGGQR
jgi:hypothetical protein